jgi:hypothetical protein
MVAFIVGGIGQTTKTSWADHQNQLISHKAELDDPYPHDLLEARRLHDS